MMKIYLFIIMLILSIKFINSMIIRMMMCNQLMMLTIMFMNSYTLSNYWMNIYSWMGLDNLSMMLSLLSIWIISMMFLISKNQKNKKMFNFMLIILLMMLLLSFMSINYFMFYLFFEISLIPTFLLIMGWGYQPERLSASMYMLLYTMFASLPMLMILFIMFYSMNSLMFFMLINKMLNFKVLEFIMYMYMILAFLVKLPMFIFHMWLPKAHVEAPVSGSMILAGVMLKLGGYGLMRSMMMMLNYSIKFNYMIMIISLIGIIYLSLLCLRTYDMKMLVAYSSVVHMSMMLLGIMTLTLWGYYSGMMMMFAHGLCSSGMFMLVNLFYERSNSRNIYLNKGLVSYAPILSMWWFMFCSCNMSAPISLNLLSEIMIICVIINWCKLIILPLMLGMYISTMYSLYLFSFIHHGKKINIINKFKSIQMNDYLCLNLHWIPLNLLILKMELFY